MPMSNAAAPQRGPRSEAPAACRHHHGWQRTLGGRARPAAGEGHRRGVEALRRAVRAATNSASAISPSSPSPRRTGRVRRPRSAICSVCCAASSATISRACIATASSVRIIGERDGLDGRHLRAAERGRGTDARQHAPDAGRRLQLRLAAGDRASGADSSREEVADGKRDRRRRSTPRRSATISMRPTFPIPISSSAPAASSGCPIS